MNIVLFDTRQTIIAAILTLYLGKYLTRHSRFLRNFNIPDAVSGGVVASLFFGFCYVALNLQIEFSLQIRDVLLIVFFTTIGLSSKLKTLLEGGKPLLILLVTALVYLVLQNSAGIAVASLLGLDPAIGILTGSVSLSGGHGTAIAWAPIFADYGIPNASEIGIANATFGLIIGGIVGGPIARYLILKYQLQPVNEEEQLSVSIKHRQKNVKIDYDTMLNSLLVLGLTIGFGLQISVVIEAIGLNLPMFVACLFAGIILTNTMPLLFKRFPWPTGTPTLALISDLSLGLFLCMSLMSLQLWTLVDVAGPILILVLVQFLLSTVYTIFLVFPVMGKDYNAAVIAAGYSGLTLGTTPTAIANMTAVTAHFGAAPQAFVILPLVGAFFIDIANAFAIQTFLNFLG
ncbi:sodium/glutamate symporter [Candidatus Synechococcus calcipolaris G9]|uniref:Sodium/glutamate symporter n=1 Tax=Candidatus Synechococcus calcipolaris G9 TaxID=1497997 RepID=A0ABT6EZF3_9SYNE|nr:sodium/glutamate symporter [Candidatus Synechococcus calcipolaris]MDG2990950.1 sodium/glutamate symporter [Candidatus Synechococcus calcipolaris G9]